MTHRRTDNPRLRVQGETGTGETGSVGGGGHSWEQIFFFLSGMKY